MKSTETMRSWKLPAFLVFLLVGFCGTTWGQDRLPADFAYEVAVEEGLEVRLTGVLEEIAGAGRVLAVVNAEVVGADIDLAKRKRLKEKDALALPGVPVKKKFGTDLPAGGLDGVNVVTRLAVTLLVDPSVDEGRVETLRETAKAVVGYVEERGDQIDLRRVSFGNRGSRWGAILYPPQIYWIFLVLAGGAFLISAAAFLTNPFKKLGGALAQGGTSRGGSGGGDAAPTIETHNVFQAPTSPETATGVDGETPLPFSFVEERHLASLAVLLGRRTAEEAATVANYLPPEWTVQLLERFPAERQVEIAVGLGSVRELEPESVRALENDLKTRLDYLTGDENRLISIMDQVNEEIREEVLVALESSDAERAARVRQRVKDFETMLRDLTRDSIAVLTRNVDPAVFAQVLKAVPAEVRDDKVLGSLSAGAAERLQQEIEMSPPLSETRLVRERRQLLSMIRRLLHEGVIEEEV